jgi:hypothetical protein
MDQDASLRSWQEVLTDLDSLTETEVEQDNKLYVPKI